MRKQKHNQNCKSSAYIQIHKTPIVSKTTKTTFLLKLNLRLGLSWYFLFNRFETITFNKLNERKLPWSKQRFFSDDSKERNLICIKNKRKRLKNKRNKIKKSEQKRQILTCASTLMINWWSCFKAVSLRDFCLFKNYTWNPATQWSPKLRSKHKLLQVKDQCKLFNVI